MLIDSLQIHCEEARFVSRGNKKKKEKEIPGSSAAAARFIRALLSARRRKAAGCIGTRGGVNGQLTSLRT